jgi:ankyrin repeat protein
MQAHQGSSNPPAQRWERPLNFLPGYWKRGNWERQLPGKVRDLAVRGDLDGLRELLAEHPEYLNKRGSHNRTFLWEAARRGRLEIVKWLVEQGAELDATGCVNGESFVQLTPYCAAVYYGRDEVAAYLLSQGAPLDIFRAAFMGDQVLVEHALTNDPTLLNADDPADDLYYVPLIAFAIVGGHESLVEFLLHQGAVVAPYSAQLLYLAARDSRLDLVELLVKYGTDVSVVDGGSFVTTPDIEMIRYLLDHGASASRPGKNRFPPLVFLSRGDKSERPDKVQLLLEYGAPVNAVGPKRRTALHYAAVGGHIKVMEVLLEYGADPKLRDEEGQTALTLALGAGKTAAAELLKH